jgi:hypothetical protein
MLLSPSTPQSLSHLIVRAVFSTKDRRPFLHSEDIRIETYASLSTNVISGNNVRHSAALSGRFSRGRPPRAEALGYSLFALRATPKCPLGIFLCVLQSRCGDIKRPNSKAAAWHARNAVMPIYLPPFLERNKLAANGTDVNLSGTMDWGFSRGHFLPVCDPPRHSADGE